MPDPDSIARHVIEQAKCYNVFSQKYFQQAVEEAHNRGQVVSEIGGEIHFIDSSFLVVDSDVDGIIIEDELIEFGTFI